jgi:hypothetical protein
MRKFTFIVIAAMLLVLGQVAIFAQSATTGVLSGTVTDPQGSVVSGATVVMKNNETGAVLTATTNDNGLFVFTQVQPATYTVTIEATGFKKAVAPAVQVEVSREAQLTIKLEIGGASETVTVTDAQEVINTTSPSLTSVVNTRQVTDLPLGGRNPVDLAGLQAGIAVVGTDVRGASVAGLRQTAVNLTQDGINSMDNFVKTSSFFAITTPSLNSTSEFSITTGTVGADAGRGAAQVNIVTKGGSNDYHGGGFYQLINESLFSNTWFNNTNGLPRPILRQKFWGFDIGGPMHFLNFGEGVPAHWSGKDKAFFFFSYEVLRQNQGRANNRTVLTQTARNGTFTYRDAAGVNQTLNLLTTSTRGFGLNPIMTAHLGLIPLPNNNTCGGDGFNISCYTYNVTQNTTNDKYVGRYDHQLVKDTKLGSHKLEFVYSKVITRTHPDVFTNGIDAPFPGGVHGFQASDRNLITPALVSTFGSNWTNVFRYGRQWAPVDFNRDTMPTAPFFSLTGVTSYDNNFMPQPRNTIVNQITDTVSWVNGNHLWKFGGDWQQVLGVSLNDAGINQQINFGQNSANTAGLAIGTQFPGITGNNAGNAIVANAVAVYSNITGLLATSSRTLNVQTPTSGFVEGYTRDRQVQGRDLALFAQDQWRVRSNFTLSYGVRWDYMGVPTVPNGLAIQPAYKDMFGISGFGNLFTPTAAPGSQTAGVATQNFVSGDTGIGLYKNDWNNFAPSVGFAWSPDFKSGPLRMLFGDSGKSSIRAGYSMSFLHDGITTFTNLLGTGTTNPGLIATQNISVASGSSNLAGVIGAGGVPLVFPAFVMPVTDRQNFLANSGNGLWTSDPDLKSAYVHQWNIGYEREIFKDTAFEIRYQGNWAPNTWRAYDINEVNIFENGFLPEYLRAQQNLAICVANSATCRAAQGTAGIPATIGALPAGTLVQTANSFQNWGLPGQVPLTIFDRFFFATATGSLPNIATVVHQQYANTTFIGNLQTNNVGTMASTLAFNPAYRTNRERTSFPAPLGLPGFAGNFFVANPNAAFSRILTNDATSNYHAMEIELRKRFSQGLQFQANYTWSKAMGDAVDAQGNNQSDLVNRLTLRDPSLDYRRSGQDQTQRFVANAVYELPFGQGKPYLSDVNYFVNLLVGGWSTGGIVTWSTGVPWHVNSGRATFTSSTANNGARLIGITMEEFKKNIGIYKTPAGIFFINPALLDITLFTTGPNAGKVSTSTLKAGLMGAPLPGTFGDFPINSLSGPQYFNFDFSVTKRFAITETVRFEVKTTFINVLNHPNFVYGSQSFDSTSFGRITDQRGNVRGINFIGQLRF